MAFIKYLEVAQIPAEHRVPDRDHVIQIHGVNAPVMKQHFELYKRLMRGTGPLSFTQREMIAVVVSSLNGCHY
jgi:alkylhydroperoxidase family enzyme